jgi:integrase
VFIRRPSFPYAFVRGHIPPEGRWWLTANASVRLLPITGNQLDLFTPALSPWAIPPSFSRLPRAELEQIVVESLAVRTLAETGMRVGELGSLEYQNVDLAGSLGPHPLWEDEVSPSLRGCTEPLLAEIFAETPPNDRTHTASLPRRHAG